MHVYTVMQFSFVIKIGNFFYLMKTRCIQQFVGVEVVFAVLEKAKKYSVTHTIWNFRLKLFKQNGPDSAASS